MEWLTILKAVVLGVIQGVTEYLPISSTAHLVLCNDLINAREPYWKVFDVFVQFGSIMAVLWAYWGRVWKRTSGLVTGDRTAWRFWINLGIAFMPAAVIGLAVHGLIKKYLHDYSQPSALWTIAGMLILGAFAIFEVERWYKRRQDRAPDTFTREVEDMSPLQALAVGVAQVLALLPGTSRSGATIVGGLLAGLSRPAATEFTFFLAMPTLGAACLYDLYKGRADISSANLLPFAAGFVVSFLVSLVAVKWLLRFVSTHNLNPFAWYRIGLGLIVIAWILLAQ